MATNPTRVERELVLLRIPSLPLAVAVGLVAVVFFSASALLGGSTALRQLEREVPLNEALWMTLAIPGIGALMGFAQGFLSTCPKACAKYCLTCLETCRACIALIEFDVPLDGMMARVCAKACDMCANKCSRQAGILAAARCIEACERCRDACLAVAH